MSNKGFDGTTVTVGGHTIGGLRSATQSGDAGDVDVTGADDDVHTSENGIPKLSLDLEFLGASAQGVPLGSKGPLIVVWNDGITSSDGRTYRVSKFSTKGSLDTEILSTLTVVPTTNT